MTQERSGPVVLHVCLSLEMGGAERLAVQMATDRLRRLGKPCAVAALSATDSSFLSNSLGADIPFRALGMNRCVDFAVCRRLRNFLRETGAGVIHAHNSGPLIAAALAAAGLPIRVVYTHHGSGVPGVFGRRPLLRWWVLRRIAVFVGVSPEATERLQQAFGGRIPAGQLRTIINGVYRGDSDRGRVSDAGRALPAFEGATIGYVGRLSGEKRVEDLLEAAAILTRRGIRCRVVIVGDGPLRGSLQEQARRRNLGESLLFLGTRSDVPQLLHEFDLFVNCSETEGISLAILEAMAAGVQVVATRTGGTPLLIEDGVSGRLVEPGSPGRLAAALADAMQDRDARARMAAEAKRRAVEQFSFERMMDCYGEIYHGL